MVKALAFHIVNPVLIPGTANDLLLRVTPNKHYWV